eukprot:TRINITY_DN9030_c0_g1_i1.p1 TRINITY_DN9030_c0_g1~~TRINITY_DN9030_c0_g1_i1.p1  ORF type:complete len:753 (-),score=166.91 TRINITY_DN9030_c0_g1_i1:32-1957(-)
MNRAAQQASGDYLVFMEDSVLINGLDSLSKMLDVFDRYEDVAVVGNKLVYPDSTIHHAGISLVLQSSVEEKFSYYTAKSEEDYPAIHFDHQGLHKLDSRSINTKQVPVVTKALMVIPQHIFSELEGFDESYNELYIDADFCMRASNVKNYKIFFVADSEAIYTNKGIIEQRKNRNNVADAQTFKDNWGTHIKNEVINSYAIGNMTLVWNMECGTGRVLGFTTEAINIVASLHKKIRMRVEVNSKTECTDELESGGLSLEMRNIMERLMDMEVSSDDTVMVIHRDPGRYDYFLPSRYKPDYVIGRSMYETDRIPSDWVEPCNSKVDKIWVPSFFNEDTFTKSGVQEDKLDIVPELIDVHHFDPLVHKPLYLPYLRDNDFSYLSIMKWEKRKAWKTLMEGYFDSFIDHENKQEVRLYILSRMDDDNWRSYDEFVDEYLQKNNVQKEDLPAVHFLGKFLPYWKLPSLYKAVDCLILPSHGEGWGLPLMEAMSMELPTVGTKWSGNTQFMNDENSYLIDVKSLEPAETEGHNWAKPDLDSFKEKIKHIFNNREYAKKKGQKARQDIVDNYSWEAASELIISKLQQIQVILPEIKANRAEEEPQYNNWYGNNNYNNNNNNVDYTPWDAGQYEDESGNIRIRMKLLD